MGKSLVYITILCVLGFGVYYFLIRDQDALYQEKEANFTFKDTAAIGKIFLVDNEGNSILVERGSDNQWVLNKKYPVMPVQILNILTCLYMQTAFTPVAEREHDRVVKLLSGLATKVEVYDRKGNKIRAFYVAGQGPNYHGSYMILENAQQPYLVEIPGFEGYLTPRYSTDFKEWRSRKVFDLAADSIESVSIQYPGEPLSSFTVKNTSGKPEIVFDPALKSSLVELNMQRANDYLNFFKQINAEGYLNGSENLDSVIQNARIRCKMSVAQKTGQTTVLDIYWIDREKYNGAQTSTDPTNRPTDVDRLYAVNQSSGDTLLIQMRTFEKFFRRSYEFYQKEQPNTRANIPAPLIK
jgi:hypothetical protein